MSFARFVAALGGMMSLAVLTSGGGVGVAGVKPLCFGKPATLVGTAKADTLVGTVKADVIVGLGGADVLKGLGGNDRLCGGAGNDRFDGGAGLDWADGGTGRNTCSNVERRRACIDLARPSTPKPKPPRPGPTTSATCDGKRATVEGTDKADVLRGTEGNDVIAGLGGHDTIEGLGGNDVICGGTGHDSIDGGSGTDRLDGEAGIDTCVDGEALTECERNSRETTFEFGPEVPADRQAVVRGAVELAKASVQQQVGVSTSDFTVFGFQDVERFVTAYARWFGIPGGGGVRERLESVVRRGGGYAEASVKVMFVWTGSGPGSRPLEQTVVHEYFHIVQNMLSPQDPTEPPSRIRTSGPAWLVEGSAEYAAYRATGAYDASLASAIQSVRSHRPSLGSMESPDGFGAAADPWSTGFVAVDLLVRTPGASSLVAYWKAIGEETPWQEAFARAFGRSVEAFYAEFQQQYL